MVSFLKSVVFPVFMFESLNLEGIVAEGMYSLADVRKRLDVPLDVGNAFFSEPYFTPSEGKVSGQDILLFAHFLESSLTLERFATEYDFPAEFVVRIVHRPHKKLPYLTNLTSYCSEALYMVGKDHASEFQGYLLSRMEQIFAGVERYLTQSFRQTVRSIRRSHRRSLSSEQLRNISLPSQFPSSFTSAHGLTDATLKSSYHKIVGSSLDTFYARLKQRLNAEISENNLSHRRVVSLQEGAGQHGASVFISQGYSPLSEVALQYRLPEPFIKKSIESLFLRGGSSTRGAPTLPRYLACLSPKRGYFVRINEGNDFKEQLTQRMDRLLEEAKVVLDNRFSKYTYDALHSSRKPFVRRKLLNKYGIAEEELNPFFENRYGATIDAYAETLHKKAEAERNGARNGCR